VTYGELDAAWLHFNNVLFAGRLRPAIITLSRANASPGWYRSDCYANDEGDLIGEISLNPSWFAVRSLRDSLAELVHQMVHQLQHEAGTAGRGGYHNLEFASVCEELGLACSHDGTPAGKRTGEGVTLILLLNGRFEAAARDLETDAYRLTWLDRFPILAPGEMDMRCITRESWMTAQTRARRRPTESPNELGQLAMPQPGQSPDAISDSVPLSRFELAPPNLPGFVETSEESEVQQGTPDGRRLMDRSLGVRQAIQFPGRPERWPSRTKYVCSGSCGAHFYGRRGIDVTCNKDGGRFVASDGRASMPDAECESMSLQRPDEVATDDDLRRSVEWLKPAFDPKAR
jgi:hypothetical protein